MQGPNFTHSRPSYMISDIHSWTEKKMSVFVRKYIFGWEKTVCFSNVYFQSARGMEKVGL
jgi:hypothetical protein